MGHRASWQYNNYHPLLLGLVLERVTGNVGLRLHGHEALRGAGSRSRCHLEPRLRGLRVREDGERSQRQAGRLRPLRAPPPPQRRVERQADRFRGLGARSDRRRAGPPTRRITPVTGTSGGWTWITRGATTPWGSTVSTSTWLPDADTVVVRVGRDWGVDNTTWLAAFRDVADQLKRRSLRCSAELVCPD